MTHRYHRLTSLVQSSIWFIEPRRAQAMADAFLMRLEAGPRRERYLSDEEREANDARAVVQRMPMPPSGKSQQIKQLAIIPMIGPILPRGDVMEDMSGGGTVSLTRFQNEFMQAATDDNVGAIILEIDSPGGQIDLVPETAALIRSMSKPGRPIVAVANTAMCSAAYWIGAAADEVVVTPSGMVGSIGVFMLHQEMAERMKMEGIVPTYVFEGARKVEGNPFEPLSDEARAAMQAEVAAAYQDFTKDVAAFRGAKVTEVRADPEKGGKSFGAGRAYSPAQLRSMGLVGRGGMVDRVATIRETITRLMGRSRPSTAKATLDMM